MPMTSLYERVVQLLHTDLTGCEIAEMLNIDVDMVYDVMDAEEEKQYEQQ